MTGARSPAWRTLAWTLVATAVVFALGVVWPLAMQLPMVVGAVASTLVWAGYLAAPLGGVARVAATLGLSAVAGALGFAVVYGAGWVGVAVVLAVYAAALLREGGEAPEPGA